jgi:hypothetical protein
MAGLTRPLPLPANILPTIPDLFADLKAATVEIEKAQRLWQTAFGDHVDSLAGLRESVLLAIQPARALNQSIAASIADTQRLIRPMSIPNIEQLMQPIVIPQQIIDSLTNPGLSAMNACISAMATQARESLALIASQVQQSSVSINLVLKEFGPFWEDLHQVHKGDAEAAVRVAARIQWFPDKSQRAAIRLKARIAGKSPEEVRLEALTQGVLMALGWNEDQRFPVLVQPQSAWARTSGKELEAICPGNLPLRKFWEWAQEEAVRAAAHWLMKLPYAATFVVIKPPSEVWDIQLFKFTSSTSENCRLDVSSGRPFGSSVFRDGESFLKEIISAAEHVKSRGDRITQERVAAVLSEKGLLGSGNPERQLRRWTEEFGFRNWLDLVAKIK